MIDNWYAFYNGFSANTKFKNSTNCFDRITNYTMVDMVQWEADMEAALNIFEKADATTLLIRKLSNAAWVCNDNLRNIAKWTNNKVI